MQWQVVVALVVAVPVILFPVALVWYLNVGGIWAAIQEARRKGAGYQKEVRTDAKE